jgi:hypothetical protein
MAPISKLSTLIASITICMSFVACTRHVNISKQMTWECAPEEYKQGYHARPDEYVRFRFVDDVHCFEVEASKNFCAELHKLGKPIVTARFDVWGGSFLAAQGYRMVAVEQQELSNVGGWGSSGSNDSIARCPLGKVIEELK